MQCLKVEDIPSSISEYFTTQEFKRIPPYERQHLSSLRQNYEALQRLGLKVQPPEFMNKKSMREKKRTTRKTVDDKADVARIPTAERSKRCTKQQKLVFLPAWKVKKSSVRKASPRKKKKKMVHYGDSHAKYLGIEPKIVGNFSHTLSEQVSQNFLRPQPIQQNFLGTLGEKDGVFSCKKCYMAYSNSTFLKKHNKRKHREKYQEIIYKPVDKDLSNRTLATNSKDVAKHCKSLVKLEHLPFTQSPILQKKIGKNELKQDALKLHKHKCEDYDSSFAYKSILQRHQNVHTKEKSYKCDVCDAMFYWPSHLLTHKRQHTGEKPYVCNICGLTFCWSSNLCRHRRNQPSSCLQKNSHERKKTTYKYECVGFALNQVKSSTYLGAVMTDAI